MTSIKIPDTLSVSACYVCGWSVGAQLQYAIICPCCGTEWGIAEINESVCTPSLDNRNILNTIYMLRGRWIGKGGEWFDPIDKPNNWNLEEQLANIPEEFR